MQSGGCDNNPQLLPQPAHLWGAFKTVLPTLHAALLAQHAGGRHSRVQLEGIKVECVGQAAAQPVDIVILSAHVGQQG